MRGKLSRTLKVKESTCILPWPNKIYFLTLTITFMMQCCITLPCFLDWLLYEECFNFFSKSLGKSAFSLKLCNQKQNLCIVYFDCIFCIDTVEWWWCYDDRDKVIWMAWTHDWIKNLWSANQWTQNPENISNHLQVTSTLLSHLRCIQGQCI